MFKLRNLILFIGTFSIAITACAASNQSGVASNENKKAVTHHKKEQAQGSVNLNTAEITQLQKIKYFGKKKAEKVLEYRKQHGNFKSVDELLNVKCRGINQKWLNKVKKFLSV